MSEGDEGRHWSGVDLEIVAFLNRLPQVDRDRIEDLISLAMQVQAYLHYTVEMEGGQALPPKIKKLSEGITLWYLATCVAEGQRKYDGGDEEPPAGEDQGSDR